MGSAAQRLIRLYGVRPGRRAVVLTGNRFGYEVALDLIEAGVEVAAVVDQRLAPEPDAAQDALIAAVLERGLRVLSGHAVVEATPAPGKLGGDRGRGRQHRWRRPGRRATRAHPLRHDHHVGRLHPDLSAGAAGRRAAQLRRCQHDLLDHRVPRASAPGRLHERPPRSRRGDRRRPPGRLARGPGRGPGGRRGAGGAGRGRRRGRQRALADFQAIPRARISSTSTRTCRSRTSSTPPPTATRNWSWSSASRPSAWGRARAATRRWPPRA